MPMKSNPVAPLIGIDIGGTKIAAAVIVTQKNTARATNFLREQTGNGTKQRVIKQIVEMVGALSTHRPARVGLSFAGQINQKGRIMAVPNLHRSLEGVYLGRELEKALRCPVTIENDANAFTLAEATVGVAKKYRHVFGMTLGTGVGAGLVINRQIYQGASGTAGEVGHMLISDLPYRCGQGHRGCVESLASGTAMAKLYYAKTKRRWHAHEVEQAALAGDRAAVWVYKLMKQSLAITLVNVMAILNPEAIVVGGGLARASGYVDDAVAMARDRALVPAHQSIPILRSTLLAEANIIGAVLAGEAHLERKKQKKV
jgi:predicted NBD/HSP70 family sugar kinase